MSGGLSVLGVVLGPLLAAFPLLQVLGVMEPSRGRHGPPDLVDACVGLFFGVGFFVAGARWLLRLPPVWVELGQLLDHTTPTAMRLRVFKRGSGKSTTYWARLRPAQEEYSARDELELKLDGLLPPWWLTRQDGARVLVYGLPPPGPYVLEFEDGWLALVHPD